MPDMRPIVELEPWLPFFLRPNNFPRAARRVDFFLCGTPSLLRPVRPVGASLTVEYLKVLEGLFRRGETLCGEFLGGECLCGGVFTRRGGLLVGGGGGGCDGASGLALCATSAWLICVAIAAVSDGGVVCSSCCCSCSRSCWGCSSSESVSSGRGVILAMPLPGSRIGTSSSFVVEAMPGPELRMGKASSVGLNIGIGPDILPRMDWRPVLGRPVLELDFQRLGMVSLSTAYTVNEGGKRVVCAAATWRRRGGGG